MSLFPGKRERGHEAFLRFVRVGEAVMQDAKVAQHDALGVDVTDVPNDRQPGFEPVLRFGEPALHLVQLPSTLPS